MLLLFVLINTTHPKVSFSCLVFPMQIQTGKVNILFLLEEVNHPLGFQLQNRIKETIGREQFLSSE